MIALLLGWLLFTSLLDLGGDDAFDFGNLPGAIIGTLILLFLYERFVAGREPELPATR
jgi:hypothetical protein